jgi:hypothetical protein
MVKWIRRLCRCCGQESFGRVCNGCFHKRRGVRVGRTIKIRGKISG